MPAVQVTRMLPMEAWRKNPLLAVLPAAREIRIKFLFDPHGNCTLLCRHRGAFPKEPMIAIGFLGSAQYTHQWIGGINMQYFAEAKQYFAFQWHITDDCDQRCKHCYIFFRGQL